MNAGLRTSGAHEATEAAEVDVTVRNQLYAALGRRITVAPASCLASV